MATGAASQLITPEEEWDRHSQIPPELDPMTGEGTFNTLDYLTDIQIDPLIFVTQPQSDVVSPSVPEPLFDDWTFFPREDDAIQPGANNWPAAGDHAQAAVPPAACDPMELTLAQFGPETAALLSAVDLSYLDPELPLPPLSPSYSAAWAYPTPAPSVRSASPLSGRQSCRPPALVPDAVSAHVCLEPGCGARFTKARQLQLHTDKHTLPHECPCCGRGHARKKDLHRHMRTRHEAEARQFGIPAEEAPCPAPGCGHRARKDNIKRHVDKKHPGLARS